jgi:predicted CXXCH cytochrome family protein
VLHWTGAANRWNFMCADCHSTGVRKIFDVDSKRYETTWSEIDVSCEACHGPGSQHVRWAHEGQRGEPSMGLSQLLGPESGANWVMDRESGIARRSPKRTEHREFETCAPCHARRSRIHQVEDGEAFLDNHRLDLLEDSLYFPDGQIRDEVYGSFIESKMYREGDTCSDCHDPHSLELRNTGDALCSQCHAADRFAAPSHHHHPVESAGTRCVSCHMPSRISMVIDDRRDHSFRVPRPDWSIELGTPNPCSSCHAQQGDAWAVSKLVRWGVAPSREAKKLSVAIASGRQGRIDAPRALRDLARLAAVPGIACATAVAALARYPSEATAEVNARAAGDSDPLLRFAVAQAAEGLPPGERISRISALLDDELRSVRIEAARALAFVPGENLPVRLRGPQRKAMAEYRSAQRLNGDDPSAHVNLALIDLAEGKLDRAEEAYLRAIDVGSYFVPAHVNLADLYRQQGRDREAEQVLREVALRAPESAEVEHSLGLVVVRLQRNEEALAALQRAAERAPESPRFVYVYAIALHSFGETPRAIEVLEACHQRHPGEPSVLQALSSMLRELGKPEAAQRYAAKLEALVAVQAE